MESKFDKKKFIEETADKLTIIYNTLKNTDSIKAYQELLYTLKSVILNIYNAYDNFYSENKVIMLYKDYKDSRLIKYKDFSFISIDDLKIESIDYDFASDTFELTTNCYQKKTKLNINDLKYIVTNYNEIIKELLSSNLISINAEISTIQKDISALKNKIDRLTDIKTKISETIKNI